MTRIGAWLCCVPIGFVAWGFWGSTYARVGGIVLLRWTWPLLLGLAVPLVVFALKLRRAERRTQR